MKSQRHVLDLILRIPIMVLPLSCLYAHTESETSYMWRLDLEVGKVMPGTYLSSVSHSTDGTNGSQDSFGELEDNQELMLDILLSTITNVDGTWKKTWGSNNRRCLASSGSCPGLDSTINNRGLPIAIVDVEDTLDCGKPVNFTYYDHLVGIQNRDSHPSHPEPDVALQHFSVKKWAKKNGEINVEAIEKRLKRSKREKPKSVDLYNQIGNFWRIKGDTQKSIECFRRALAVSPNNAEILLNLARVLFNLQYLDDAIFLTRRSLEVQPPDQNAWKQHFQLGEILKAYRHYQEATLHLRHVLELKPNYGPALAALQDMDSIPDNSVHLYTFIIIIILVFLVISWVLKTQETPWEEFLANSSLHDGQVNRLQRLRLRRK